MALTHWQIYAIGGALLLWLCLRLKARSSRPPRRPLTPRYSKLRLDVVRERNWRAKQKEAGQDDECSVQGETVRYTPSMEWQTWNREAQEEALVRYREKFQHGPIGRWIMYMDFASEEWMFFPNGSGTISHKCERVYAQSKFTWECIGEQTLSVCLLEYMVKEKSEPKETPPWEEDLGLQVTVRYDFQIITYGSSEEQKKQLQELVAPYDYRVTAHDKAKVVLLFLPVGKSLPFWMEGVDGFSTAELHFQGEGA